MRAFLAILAVLTCLPCDGQVRRRAFGPKKPPAVEPDPMTFGIADRFIWTNFVVAGSNWTNLINSANWFISPNGIGPRTNNSAIEFRDYQQDWLNYYVGGAPSYMAVNMTYPGNDVIAMSFGAYNLTSSKPLLQSSSPSGPVFGMWTTNGNKFGVPSGLFGTAVGATVYDVVFGMADGSTNYPCYTNGQKAVVFTAAQGNWSVNNMGQRASTDWFYGIVYEFVHWTNVGTFSSNQVWMIHNYMTNAYHYTP